ncbi:MAG: SH3 domain-containing protein [Anaerolineales bacterium]|nr:SH3 domain-containing protein [Anaerolineales bacterium]
MRFWLKISFWFIFLLGLLALFATGPARTPVLAQQSTGSVPTVTGTATGPIVTITYPEQVNVRAGPSSVYYPAIGVMLPGQTAPALGRTSGGEWIQIYYPGVPGDVGWIYAPLVSLTPGFLPIVEPPPTATPRTTPTIDPTLQAAFQVPMTPTRLPTFTPAPPLSVPTFERLSGTRTGVPMGLVLFGLALVGMFGALVSFLRGR